MTREMFPVHESDLCPVCGEPATTNVSFDVRSGYRGVLCAACSDRYGVELHSELQTVRPVTRRRNGSDQMDFFGDIE